MKKLFKTYRLPALIAFGGCLLLLGCTNSDYDFDKVDKTLGFGSGQLTLPSNNSINVTLDDILDLGSTDLITVAGNGDYQFGKDPESISPVNVKVDKITSGCTSTAVKFPDIDLSAIPAALKGKTIKLSDYGITLVQEGNISLMDYEFAVPAEVKELEYVELQDGTHLKISISVPNVTKLNLLEITLPNQLVVNSQAGFDPSTNKLSLTNYSVSGGKVNLDFVVTQIKAILENQTFKLQSNISLKVDIAELTVPDSPTLSVSGNVNMDNISITAARGKFKPTINAQQVGSATINSLPDFLTDARVVADIDNPQIWLDIESNLPLGGTVEAKLTSSTWDGFVELTKAKGNALEIAANQTTKIVVCRKAPAGLTGYTPVIANDLSNIVKKLAEGMKINIDITSFDAEDATTTFLLGNNYTFKPNYKFNAPLALGDEAVIIYNDKENDWNKDLKDIQLQSGSKVVLTADVDNTVPADLEINIKPLDSNGQEVTALNVKPIQNKVKAGAAVTQIEYDIFDTNGKGLQQLDGINYDLNVIAPSDAAQKGKTLNKNQKILLKNVKLQLTGKVIHDAN